MAGVISEHEPRKGTETRCFRRPKLNELALFQNTNPERGRKHLGGSRVRGSLLHISEHEPRKGTETYSPASSTACAPAPISEHEPRKGTETESMDKAKRRDTHRISEHEPRKGTETQGEAALCQAP